MSGVNAVLSRMGVVGPNGERSPVLAPILSHKFRVTFYGIGGPTSDPVPYDLTRQIQSIDLPSISVSEATINSYVSELYIPTYSRFSGPLNITFIDDITNSVSELLYSHMYRTHNFFDVTHTRAAENPKFSMDIDILAGGASASDQASDPNVLRKYCVGGCFLTSLNEGNMAYQNQAVKTINTSMRFDTCIVFDHNGNRLGKDVTHSTEIDQQLGDQVTGIGGDSQFGINGAGVSIGASASVSLTGSAALNLTF